MIVYSRLLLYMIDYWMRRANSGLEVSSAVSDPPLPRRLNILFVFHVHLGSLAGKFVATFFSTASQHGGQETTALNAVTYFAHHGMLYVPFGFANAAMFDNNEVIGGSAYGSGTVTNGDGSRQPSETELAIAKNQAKNFAAILNTYKKGELAASTRTTAAVAEAPSTSSSEPKSAERKTPVITTTNPEGQTEDAPATDGGSAAGAAATGAAAGGVAAGAVASTEATSKAAQPSTELASKENAPAATGTSPSDRQQQQQQQKSTTSQQQQLQEQESAARPTQEKPKKKKKLLWFCCGGNDSQLD